MSKDNEHADIALLQEMSKQYAKNSTRLSLKLKQAEEVLNTLDGKVEVVVDCGESCQLRFARVSDGDWRLVLTEEVIDYDNETSEFCETIVNNSTVADKARAAAVLPELMRAVFDVQQIYLTEIDKGLKAMATLPWLNDSVDEDSGLFDVEEKEVEEL